MNAHFQMEGPNKSVLVVQPEYGPEAMLMALFLRYDANVFSVSVERHENGQIKEVTFIAGSD